MNLCSTVSCFCFTPFSQGDKPVCVEGVVKTMGLMQGYTVWSGESAGRTHQNYSNS